MRVMPQQHQIPQNLLFVQASSNAEMLVDMDMSGRILHAEGAFHTHFGKDSVVGSQVEELLSPMDRAAFPFTLAQILTSDQMDYHIIELSDPQQSRMMLSGLRSPDDNSRLRLLFSIAPVASHVWAVTQHLADLSNRVCGAALHRADHHLLLVELSAPAEDFLSDADTHCQSLKTLLTEIMRAENAVPVSDTRYVVEVPDNEQAATVRDRIYKNFRSHHSSYSSARLDFVTLPLREAGLVATQVARTLNFALNQFAEGGLPRLQYMGLGSGLSGFVDHAAIHAKTLRETIRSGDFSLVLQPIVDLRHRTPLLHEAFLRLPARLPELLRSPFTFVTLATTVGLGENLDYAVLERVLSTLSEQTDKKITINVSVHSLQNPRFCNRVLERLDKTPALAARLVIDITEVLAAEDLSTAYETLSALTARQVGLCVDDFNLEQRNIDFLRNIRPAYVKIDGHYVNAAIDNSYNRHVLEEIVKTSTGAKTAVIVKRLETEAQVRMAQANECSYGQGWIFNVSPG